MPALKRSDLIFRITSSIEDSGYKVLSKGSLDTKPFIFSITNGEEQLDLLIYAWTLTKGGGTGRSRSDEYKIQMTLPHWEKGLVTKQGVITLLLGWSEEFKVWVGFDTIYHQVITGRSNMISVYGDALGKAKDGGIGMNIKGNNETAIAFPSYSFVEYAKTSVDLHNYALEPTTAEAIEDFSTYRDPLEISDVAAVEREKIVTTIIRPYRNNRFRYNVLTVYQNRCAISGVQLKLVEAAHIIPVNHPTSTDEVKNGICLSALYHKAYDIGLIGITPNYHVIINPALVQEMQFQSLDGGLEALQKYSGASLLLPKESKFYPSPDYLKQGMELRGWKVDDYAFE